MESSLFSATNKLPNSGAYKNPPDAAIDLEKYKAFTVAAYHLFTDEEVTYAHDRIQEFLDLNLQKDYIAEMLARSTIIATNVLYRDLDAKDCQTDVLNYLHIDITGELSDFTESEQGNKHRDRFDVGVKERGWKSD